MSWLSSREAVASTRSYTWYRVQGSELLVRVRAMGGREALQRLWATTGE
jgi:hypothetical protein